MKQFKERRKALKMSQEQLAKRLGIPVESFSRYESGASDPRHGLVCRWADELGLCVLALPKDVIRDAMGG